MKVFFKNKQKVFANYQKYTPSAPKKFYFKQVEYIRLGSSYSNKHDLIWRTSRLFKTIRLVLLFCCHSNKKLINRSWKEFKSGLEKVSIYVKKELDQDKVPNTPKEKFNPANNELFKNLEQDLDPKIINNYDELLNFLTLHLGHQESEEKILRILPKIPYDKLENLISSEKPLSGQNLLTFFSLDTKVFPQNLQIKIAEKIKIAFDQEEVLAKSFSIQEILGLIHLKLESHPKILHAITMYCPEMVERTFNKNVTNIPENLLFQCSLILNHIFSHKQISDALGKTLDDSCQNIQLNELPPKKVLSLLLMYNIGIEVPDLETLTLDKIKEIAKVIDKEHHSLTGVQGLSLLLSILPVDDDLVPKLEAIILEMSDHSLMHYLNQEQNELFEIACLNVLKGCHDTKNVKVQQGLKILLAQLEEKGRLDDLRAIWNHMAEEATPEQVSYLLSLPFKGNEKDRMCLLIEAVKKDVSGFLKTIPATPQLKTVLKQFLKYSNEELPELSLLIREMASQDQLLTVLKNYPKLFTFSRLLPELTKEELKACINHFALQPIDDLMINESLGKFALVDIFFSLYLDFLENVGTMFEVEAKMNFFDFYEELVKTHPHQIKQAFHGIRLALEMRLQPLDINDYKNNREWLDERMVLINEIYETYPETKEVIDVYFLSFAKKFFDGKPEIFHEKIIDKELSILGIALAVRKNLFLENKAEWLSKINPEYLPYLFIYLQADQQKAILKLLSEKYHQAIKNPKDPGNEFLLALDKIRLILSPEEMQQLV